VKSHKYEGAKDAEEITAWFCTTTTVCVEELGWIACATIHKMNWKTIQEISNDTETERENVRYGATTGKQLR
jgi:hypothetical protein